MKKRKSKRKYFFARRAKANRILLKYKRSIGECKRCGWNKYPEILVFHHRNPNTKEFNITQRDIQSISWERILKEIKKCDLLCPNCHVYHHYKNKKWFKKFIIKRKYLDD